MASNANELSNLQPLPPSDIHPEEEVVPPPPLTESIQASDTNIVDDNCMEINLPFEKNPRQSDLKENPRPPDIDENQRTKCLSENPRNNTPNENKEVDVEMVEATGSVPDEDQLLSGAFHQPISESEANALLGVSMNEKPAEPMEDVVEMTPSDGSMNENEPADNVISEHLRMVTSVEYHKETEAATVPRAVTSPYKRRRDSISLEESFEAMDASTAHESPSPTPTKLSRSEENIQPACSHGKVGECVICQNSHKWYSKEDLAGMLAVACKQSLPTHFFNREYDINVVPIPPSGLLFDLREVGSVQPAYPKIVYGPEREQTPIFSNLRTNIFEQPAFGKGLESGKELVGSSNLRPIRQSTPLREPEAFSQATVERKSRLLPNPAASDIPLPKGVPKYGVPEKPVGKLTTTSSAEREKPARTSGTVVIEKPAEVPYSRLFRKRIDQMVPETEWFKPELFKNQRFKPVGTPTELYVYYFPGVSDISWGGYTEKDMGMPENYWYNPIPKESLQECENTMRVLYSLADERLGWGYDEEPADAHHMEPADLDYIDQAIEAMLANGKIMMFYVDHAFNRRNEIMKFAEAKFTLHLSEETDRRARAVAMHRHIMNRIRGKDYLTELYFATVGWRSDAYSFVDSSDAWVRERSRVVMKAEENRLIRMQRIGEVMWNRTRYGEVPAEVEKPARTEKPKPASVEKSTRVEKPASVEKSTKIEKPASVEKSTRVEKPASVEKSTKIEKPARIDKPAVTKKSEKPARDTSGTRRTVASVVVKPAESTKTKPWWAEPEEDDYSDHPKRQRVEDKLRDDQEWALNYIIEQGYRQEIMPKYKGKTISFGEPAWETGFVQIGGARILPLPAIPRSNLPERFDHLPGIPFWEHTPRHLLSLTESDGEIEVVEFPEVTRETFERENLTSRVDEKFPDYWLDEVDLRENQEMWPPLFTHPRASRWANYTLDLYLEQWGPGAARNPTTCDHPRDMEFPVPNSLRWTEFRGKIYEPYFPYLQYNLRRRSLQTEYHRFLERKGEVYTPENINAYAEFICTPTPSLRVIRTTEETAETHDYHLVVDLLFNENLRLHTGISYEMYRYLGGRTLGFRNEELAIEKLRQLTRSQYPPVSKLFVLFYLDKNGNTEGVVKRAIREYDGDVKGLERYLQMPTYAKTSSPVAAPPKKSVPVCYLHTPVGMRHNIHTCAALMTWTNFRDSALRESICCGTNCYGAYKCMYKNRFEGDNTRDPRRHLPDQCREDMGPVCLICHEKPAHKTAWCRILRADQGVYDGHPDDLFAPITEVMKRPEHRQPRTSYGMWEAYQSRTQPARREFPRDSNLRDGDPGEQ